jgi:hypothetical protein
MEKNVYNLHKIFTDALKLFGDFANLNMRLLCSYAYLRKVGSCLTLGSNALEFIELSKNSLLTLLDFQVLDKPLPCDYMFKITKNVSNPLC